MPSTEFKECFLLDGGAFKALETHLSVAPKDRLLFGGELLSICSNSDRNCWNEVRAFLANARKSFKHYLFQSFRSTIFKRLDISYACLKRLQPLQYTDTVE